MKEFYDTYYFNYEAKGVRLILLNFLMNIKNSKDIIRTFVKSI